MTAQEMEEFRQDLLLEQFRETEFEIKMRNDDDFFYDYLVDKYGICITNMYNDLVQYGREDFFNDWTQSIVEK